jgi:hypothetical protein
MRFKLATTCLSLPDRVDDQPDTRESDIDCGGVCTECPRHADMPPGTPCVVKRCPAGRKCRADSDCMGALTCRTNPVSGDLVKRCRPPA